MRRVQIVTACLVAMLIVGSRTPATAQTTTSRSTVAAAQRIGALTMDRALLDVNAERPFGTRDEGGSGRVYVPHRHWSWLFPSTRVPPFASDHAGAAIRIRPSHAPTLVARPAASTSLVELTEEDTRRTQARGLSVHCPRRGE